ncbi:MAG: class I SAM-dependent methyltransferase [Candidatus Peribacteraceae bacterium]
MPTNNTLQKFYNCVYKKGERTHYTQFRLQKGDMPEEFRAVLGLLPWEGKEVLDAGCGTGDMCALIAAAGAAHVTGIDYAESAITEAKKKYGETGAIFLQKSIDEMEGEFDAVISLGTLEHMDDPLRTLRHLKGLLKPGGSLIVTCPNWLNLRGYVLQTLWHLFRAPITLADLHYLTPGDFEEWGKQLGMRLEWSTVDSDWGQGKKMVEDFKRRLPNVARDAHMAVTQEQIDGFIRWLEQRALPFQKEEKQSGAVGVYHFRMI